MNRELEIILIFAVISAAVLSVLIPLILKKSTGKNRLVVRIFYISAPLLIVLLFAFHFMYDGVMHIGAEREGLRIMMSFDYKGTADGYHILVSRGFQMGATYFPETCYAVPEEGRTALPLTDEVIVWYDENDDLPKRDTPTERIGQFDCHLWKGAKKLYPDLGANTLIYALIVIPTAILIFSITEAIYITVKRKKYRTK